MASEFVFSPVPMVSIPVVGEAARFPVHRIYCVGRNYEEHAKEMASPAASSDSCLAMPRRPANARNVTSADVPDATQASAMSKASEAVAASGALATPVVLAAAETVEVAGDRSQSDASGILRALRGIDLTMVWLGAAVAWLVMSRHAPPAHALRSGRCRPWGP